MIDSQELQDVLLRVATGELSYIEKNDLVLLALAVWHEGYVPDETWIKKLDERSQHVIGYIIEFMAGFNVLCNEECENLLRFVATIKPSQAPSVTPDEYRDELATEWGLENDLTPYFQYISHYQTRHYKHDSEYQRPSPNFVL